MCSALPTIELAKLKFVDIKVAGLPGVIISALADSGSEINVARSDVLSGVALTSVGVVQLRGILGAPVTAKLVRLHVQLADELSGEYDYLPIICAVCDDVNEEFILTSHVVDQLRDMYNRKLISTNIDHDVNDHCTFDVNECEIVNSDCCNVAVTRDSRYNLRSSKASETNSVSPASNSSASEYDYSAIDNQDDSVVTFVDADIVEPIKSAIGKASADQLRRFIIISH